VIYISIDVAVLGLIVDSGALSTVLLNSSDYLDPLLHLWLLLFLLLLLILFLNLNLVYLL
jgi:hypothetical protein